MCLGIFAGTAPGHVVAKVEDKLRLDLRDILHDAVERDDRTAAGREIARVRISHQDGRVSRRAFPLSGEAAGCNLLERVVGTLFVEQAVFVASRRDKILQVPVEHRVSLSLQGRLGTFPVSRALFAQFDKRFGGLFVIEGGNANRVSRGPRQEWRQ